MRISFVSAIVALAATASASADEPPLASSRPGQTEGAVAVPAGHLQVESELGSSASSNLSGVKTDAYSLGASYLRYGLGSGYDVEMLVQPWREQRVSSGGVHSSISGVGDTTLRVLKTLTGENGDGPALAVIGFVSVPTAKKGLGASRAEGGAIVTEGLTLSKEWGAAWTLGAASRYQGASAYQAEFSGAAQLNRSFSPALAGYVELAAVRDEHDSHTAATFDFGGTWLAAPTTQLDAGVNLGVTRSADDANIFIGMTHRF